MFKKNDYDRHRNNIAITEKVIGRSLPFSIDAEKSVLGALLLHDKKMDVVTEILSSTDFYVPANKTIFEAMLRISSNKNRIDLITLQDELNKMGKLSEIGGIVYLLSLQEDIPGLGLVEQHSKIVKEKSVLRELVEVGTNIITNCYNQNDKDIPAILDETEKSIFSISQKRSQKDFIQLSICAYNTFKMIDSLKNKPRGVVTGIPTAYNLLNEKHLAFKTVILLF